MLCYIIGAGGGGGGGGDTLRGNTDPIPYTTTNVVGTVLESINSS